MPDNFFKGNFTTCSFDIQQSGLLRHTFYEVTHFFKAHFTDNLLQSNSPFKLLFYCLVLQFFQSLHALGSFTAIRLEDFPTIMSLQERRRLIKGTDRGCKHNGNVKETKI